MPPKKQQQQQQQPMSASASATATAVAPSSTNKKRKVRDEEDEHILKYAKQIQKKEMEKKQRLLLQQQQQGQANDTTKTTTATKKATTTTTPNRRKTIASSSANSSVGSVGSSSISSTTRRRSAAVATTTSKVTTPTKRQVKKSIGTSSSTTAVAASLRKQQPVILENDHEDDDDDDEEVDDDDNNDNEIPSPPLPSISSSNKRRRIDNTTTAFGNLSTSNNAFTNVTSTTSIAIPAAATNERTLIPSQIHSTNTIPITSTTTTAAEAAAFQNMMFHTNHQNNITLTPPQRDDGTMAMKATKNKTTTTSYISKPPSSQIISQQQQVQRPSTSSTFTTRTTKRPSLGGMKKAPFGSPIPTNPLLSNHYVQQQQYVQQQPPPPPTLPSVKDLNSSSNSNSSSGPYHNAHQQKIILSPNYNKSSVYDEATSASTYYYNDADTTGGTYQIQQQQEHHQIEQVKRMEQVNNSVVSESDSIKTSRNVHHNDPTDPTYHTRLEQQQLYYERNVAKKKSNKDIWIASTAFVVVLLLSIVIAFIMDPSVFIASDTTSFTKLENITSTLSSFFTKSSSIIPTLVTITKQPCFMDYPIRSNIEIEEEMITGRGGSNVMKCEKSSHQKPCPKGGHCIHGQLKLCYDSYLEVSSDKTSCVYTEPAQRDINAIVDVLTKYTIQHICLYHRQHKYAIKNPFYIQESSYHDVNDISSDIVPAISSSSKIQDPMPLFDYRSISDILQLSYNPKLILHASEPSDESTTSNNGNNMHQKVLITERNVRDGSIMIGLHPSHDIPIPFNCYMKRLFFAIVSTLFSTTSWLVVTIITWILSYYIQYPITLSILIIIGSIIMYIKQKQHKLRLAQIQFTNEIVSFRERVYDELIKDRDQSIPARIIVDRIAWNMYPKSSKQRRRIHETIFPHIVQDLNTDSRVLSSLKVSSSIPSNNNNAIGRLFQGTTTGTEKPELHWKWNDIQPHSSTKKNIDTASTQKSN